MPHQKISSVKRILIYHHYNPNQGLSSYVTDALARLKPLFQQTIFVSNSQLDDEMTRLLSPYCHQIIQRENKGFDFGGWRDAIFALGWDRLCEYDGVTLMNDTCFGPLFDMQIVYDQMDAIGADFWGITIHPKRKSGMPGTGRAIPVHIQSYFITFTNRVCQSAAFQNFWLQLKDLPNVNLVIQKYEAKLTGILADAGFTFRALIDLEMLKSEACERAMFYEPDLLLMSGSPLVKVKSFLLFKSPPCLLKLISKHSKYDVSLIEEYFTDVHNPNISINISNKNIILLKSDTGKNHTNLSAALHFHVYYIDVFERNIMKLYDNNSASVDLYITTDSEEKKERIIEFTKENNIKDHVRKILLVENLGRDVLPWIKIAPLMKRYDIAGHFHTKKSLINKDWIGESWMDELADQLLVRVDEVIAQFSVNEGVGIIIPDIPVFYKNILGIDLWNEPKAKFSLLWDKMKLKKQIDPLQIFSPIMPYGNMYWYRPDALEPLYSLDLPKEKFSPEPCPPHGTIAHLFETLPVYVAWARGYDFRVILNPDFPFSGFNFTSLKRLIDQKQDIYSSVTWRVGRLISFLPGKLYRYFHRLFS